MKGFCVLLAADLQKVSLAIAAEPSKRAAVLARVHAAPGHGQGVGVWHS